MYHCSRIAVTDLNPHLMCVLCGGYFVDATTIIECLHSFCRTCIVRYLESSKFCPICDVQVHKTRPLLNIRSDKTLQDLVYKLVPGLFDKEMVRRREFLAAHPEVDTRHMDLEQRGRATMVPPHSLPTDRISLVLRMLAPGSSMFSKPASTLTSSLKPKDSRYLLCPSDVSIGHLKKFVRIKFGLSEKYKIDVFYQQSDEVINDVFTLLDVTFIYSWDRKSPLSLCYCIYEKPRRKRLLTASARFLAARPSSAKRVRLKHGGASPRHAGNSSDTGKSSSAARAAAEPATTLPPLKGKTNRLPGKPKGAKLAGHNALLSQGRRLKVLKRKDLQAGVERDKVKAKIAGKLSPQIGKDGGLEGSLLRHPEVPSGASLNCNTASDRKDTANQSPERTKDQNTTIPIPNVAPVSSTPGKTKVCNGEGEVTRDGQRMNKKVSNAKDVAASSAKRAAALTPVAGTTQGVGLGSSVPTLSTTFYRSHNSSGVGAGVNKAALQTNNSSSSVCTGTLKAPAQQVGGECTGHFPSPKKSSTAVQTATGDTHYTNLSLRKIAGVDAARGNERWSDVRTQRLQVRWLRELDALSNTGLSDVHNGIHHSNNNNRPESLHNGCNGSVDGRSASPLLTKGTERVVGPCLAKDQAGKEREGKIVMGGGRTPRVTSNGSGGQKEAGGGGAAFGGPSSADASFRHRFKSSSSSSSASSSNSSHSSPSPALPLNHSLPPWFLPVGEKISVDVGVSSEASSSDVTSPGAEDRAAGLAGLEDSAVDLGVGGRPTCNVAQAVFASHAFSSLVRRLPPQHNGPGLAKQQTIGLTTQQTLSLAPQQTMGKDGANKTEKAELLSRGNNLGKTFTGKPR